MSLIALYISALITSGALTVYSHLCQTTTAPFFHVTMYTLECNTFSNPQCMRHEHDIWLYIHSKKEMVILPCYLIPVASIVTTLCKYLSSCFYFCGEQCIFCEQSISISWYLLLFQTEWCECVQSNGSWSCMKGILFSCMVSPLLIL